MYLSKIFNFNLLKIKEPKTLSHIHGVFVKINGKGVLIIGSSGIGKSEVALDLIYRGHKLIADDSVVFYKNNQNILIGRAPSLLKNLMEVRGLGVLNIQKLFGYKSITTKEKLFLVVELIPSKKIISYPRLEMKIDFFKLFDVAIPKIEFPMNQTRHVSLLIETAVKNFILLNKRSNTIKEFSKKLSLQLSLDH